MERLETAYVISDGQKLMVRPFILISFDRFARRSVKQNAKIDFSPSVASIKKH